MEGGMQSAKPHCDGSSASSEHNPSYAVCSCVYLKTGGPISSELESGSNAHFDVSRTGILGVVDQLDWLAYSCVALNATAVHCCHPTPHIAVGEHVRRGQVPLVGRSQNILKTNLQEFVCIIGNNLHLPGVLGPLADDVLVLTLLLVNWILCPLLITGL